MMINQPFMTFPTSWRWAKPRMFQNSHGTLLRIEPSRRLSINSTTAFPVWLFTRKSRAIGTSGGQSGAVDNETGSGTIASMCANERRESAIGVNVIAGRRVTVATSEAAICGELYHGRPIVQPRIRFTNPIRKSFECPKDYRHAVSHSTGLFTVPCAWKNPKLLGISVMMSRESLSTTLNAIICWIVKIPRIFLYENACNLTESTVLRFLWVM